MIKVQYIYILFGLLMAYVTFLSFRDRSNPKRWLTGAFWGLFALIYLLGDVIPPMYAGIMVILMSLIAGLGGVRAGKHQESSIEERESRLKRLGNKIFIPAISIPLVTVIFVLFIKDMKINGQVLLDEKNATLVSLGIACVIALILSVVMLKDKWTQPFKESRRLFDAISWAAVLPQMLATLGGLFAVAGVGGVIAKLLSSVIPVDNRFVVVLVYAVGMALFTMIMGNAFAAFPVLTAGIGLPLIVIKHGGDPAIMAAIGMFSGYCGTLLTPMAANFNIVPAALLDLQDQHAVIKAQAPTAILLLIVNVFLMYFLVF
ncbi:DUF979 domain-containing protein [Thermoflavimicrobium dichotomicum]|uniref:Uncharacterized membrane protein n=1 Tax=Thermoflavimicrobium dichotomicum TaxID=46223 RepID=A0A1I3L436_9BACL|nr:DUF979 domain-containing protein [Thermoflavimicrobium dichotomicum]SFI79447.1 Uncharacterized membrane protein [Thermoflavimicrobium dichotomicum]